MRIIDGDVVAIFHRCYFALVNFSARGFHRTRESVAQAEHRLILGDAVVGLRQIRSMAVSLRSSCSVETVACVRCIGGNCLAQLSEPFVDVKAIDHLARFQSSGAPS